jgi:microtubule-associated protein-like 6
MRDQTLETWTCTLGWPVQGIWPKCADGTDINAVDLNGSPSMNDKSKKKKTLITADDSGKLKMFRWPCIEKGSPFSVESGHASHVTNVRWNSNSKWVVSTGGNDRCVFQWKHVADDAEDEAEEFTKDLDSEDEADYLDGDLWDRPDVVSRVNEENMHALMELEEKQDADAKADDFRPVKPWEGSIVGPTNPPRDDPTLPEERLELEEEGIELTSIPWADNKEN